MKVLAYIRNDYKHNLGGDSIQFIKTVECLEKKGIDIKISSNPNENLSPYDLIHIFNTIRIKDTYKYYMNCRAFKKKIVLTPIYWNYGNYLYNNFNDIKYIKYWLIENSLRKEVIQNSDLILPSSKLELNNIENDFKVKKPYKIIYNGVDENFLSSSPKKFLEKYNIKDEKFILSVGRICPHKNQLTLSKICKDINIPLIIIGPINDIEYFNQCKNVNSSLIHIDKLSHEELASAYGAAEVHCLVSWYETPGLVNLEAGISGCKVLTTSEGSTKEYFKNYVKYSLWDDSKGILENLLKLLNGKKDNSLKNYILNNFLWENVTKPIVDAYQEVLK